MSSTSATSSSTSGSLVSSLGVGSGLDLSTLLTNLKSAEQLKLTPITDQQSAASTKLSAYGVLQAALASFQTAATTLGTTSLYNGTTTSSSNTSVLTTSSDSTAVAGSYAVNVSQLAQSQTLVSNGVTDSTGQLLGSATIKIQLGTTATSGGTTTFTPGSTAATSININGTNGTLSGIRDAINAANAGVTASIVNDGSSTPYHLVLTSNSTGAASSMSISVSSSGSGDPTTISNLLTYNPGGTTAMTQNIAAQDAKLTINGLAISSASNTVQGAAQGVTLNLATTGTSTVGVASNTGAMATAVQSFVTSYNTLQSTTAQLSAYDPSTKTAGVLLGDSTLRVVENQLRNVINAPQTATGTSSLTNLTQIGISFNADGSMSLDSSKLNTALTTNRTGVAQLFSGTDGKSGYGNQLSAAAAGFVSTTGALTSATDGVNATLKSLATEYTTVSAQIDAAVAQYQTQFQNLDTLMAQMNSTKTYLTQQFSSSSSSSTA
ncbi:flagellar filament capping protein FliD [Cupriavidus basilensis]|uniref:Flagellar hook-associated protein 2 n=1 Tax=Cupriavidus basilensis TaxID=68895 RepID=A0ABT6AN96_9BURK|nr:flagellar filament capping protein FliD [Cupriavidus basilensis]MDF3834094.1 flagellar filament capping protein FliD [Cupriavidus basilensis]